MTGPAGPNGLELLADAIALVRCVIARDEEGQRAVVNGCDNPRGLAVMVAVIAAGPVHLGGARTPGEAEDLLACAHRGAADALLDMDEPSRAALGG